MASTDHDISVLNSLIQTTLDSMKGFRDAADDVSGTRLQSMFSEFSSERSRVATLLQNEVRRLGGTPEDESSFLAAAHRRFMDLKASIVGKEEKAVVEEVERGEDYIKGKFTAAMNDTELSPSTMAVITEAFGSVRAGHDRASALKHSME